MNEPIDIKKIFSLLPHRYPFLLVDRVIDYKLGEYLTAIKNVTFNENYFPGHFPGNPVMPGVMILEAMAQTCALLASISDKPREGYATMHYFAGIDNAKFKYMVTPGDQLRFEVKMLGRKRDFWRMHAEAYVGDKLACSADLLSAAKEIEQSDK